MKYKIALTAALTNRMWKFIDYFSRDNNIASVPS